MATVGLHLPPKPPLYSLRLAAYAARVLRLENLTIWDHTQDLFPTALWDRDFTWIATQNASPHEFFQFQVALGYLAAHAGRLRLGVVATSPMRVHPILLAQSMLTLAHMTKRSPILGIGSGEREALEPYGLPTDRPVGRLEEALQILRLCFSSPGPYDFEGRFYRLDRAVMDLKAPRKRQPEIWVAAHGPRMLQLTGRYGDCWIPVAVGSPQDYASRLETVRQAACEAGRGPDAVRPAVQLYTIIAPSEAEARAMLRSKPARFVGVLAPAEIWRHYGLRHPFGDDFPGFTGFLPEEHDRRSLEEAMAQVPEEALAEAMIWGTPEQVARRMRAFTDAGARHVNIELVSAVISRKAMLYGLRALGQIRKALRDA